MVGPMSTMCRRRRCGSAAGFAVAVRGWHNRRSAASNHATTTVAATRYLAAEWVAGWRLRRPGRHQQGHAGRLAAAVRRRRAGWVDGQAQRRAAWQQAAGIDQTHHPDAQDGEPGLGLSTDQRHAPAGTGEELETRVDPSGAYGTSQPGANIAPATRQRWRGHNDARGRRRRPGGTAAAQTMALTTTARAWTSTRNGCSLPRIRRAGS